MQNDQRLAGRIAKNDRRAFEEFVDTYGPRVHRLVRRYARSETDAEDLTQEIFLDLFRGIGGFRGHAALGTWVYRVALNHCLKHRDRACPPTLPYEDSLAADDTCDPVHRAVQGELSDQVHLALNRLSPQHQDVVILHEMHGLTYQECAAVLQVPVGTVKSRLFAAFGRLRQGLSGYVLGEGTVLCSDPLPETSS